MKIAFYISGHGLGHAMRMKAVIGRLLERAPGAEIIVNGRMPAWVFAEKPLLKVRRRVLLCDVGAIQKNSLQLDIRATLERNALFFSAIDETARSEADFIRREEIGLVVGDIPPLAFLAASQAGVKSIAVGNFSWDWIYEDYTRAFPDYGYLVDLVRDAYRRASLLLRLPFHGEMGAFPVIRDISLISRLARLSPTKVRAALGVGRDEKRKLVFISMGGHDNEGIVRAGSDDFGNYLFVSYFPIPTGRDNVILLRNRAAPPHPDIVQASDLVISKPGYCTITECIANRTALMYTSRDSFREYPVMERAIKEHLPSYLMPRGDFHSGAWRPHLDAFFSGSLSEDFSRPETAVHGADEAARIILGLVEC